MPSCRQCSQAFEITSDDLAFYERVSPVFNGKKELIPPPTLCPECRMQRRLVWRNERVLYHRKCDFSGRQIISIYSQDKPFRVFSSDFWWSDAWDPLSFGRGINFSQSFFLHLKQLQVDVPYIALFSRENENSDFTNHVYQMKNCYLVSTAVSCQNCYYGDWIITSNDCVDCSHVTNCESCYESSYNTNSHNCAYLFESDRCSDSRFLFDCRDCHHCLFCWNLRQQEYCIENKKVSPEEYARVLAFLNDYSALRASMNAFHILRQKNAIYPFRQSTNVEMSIGDQLIECRNAQYCFDVHRAQDVRFICDAIDISDSADCNYTAFHCSLNYEDHACDGSQSVSFSTRCYDNQNLLYCDLCHNCQYCFGCIGLRRKQYCILNKQYSQEEYEILVPRIIEKMRTDGEWGEFFPIALSPFGYNETVAQEYYPLTKELALKRGWKWHDEEVSNDQYMGPTYQIPDNIRDVHDDITKQILRCEVSGKPYKIIPQELKFYREMGIPIPRKCPDQRHKERMALRNPRKLWSRQCAKCSAPIQTTYSPDRPEIVYCEECYLKTVY